MLELILVLVLIPLLFAFAITAMGIAQVKALSSHKSALTPVDIDGEQKELNDMGEFIDWADANGFVWIDAYRATFPGIALKPLVLAWQRDDGTYFTAYKMGNTVACDLLTSFDEQGESVLTTSRTKSGQPHPAYPTAYTQVFPSADLDTLLRHHHEALAFLQTRMGKVPHATSMPFEAFFLHVLRQQMRYIRTIPLWQLRFTYWWLRRHRFKNIPVTQKYDFNFG